MITKEMEEQLKKLKEKLSPAAYNEIIIEVYRALPEPDLTKGVDPTPEQLQWVNKRMRGSSTSWKVWSERIEK